MLAKSTDGIISNRADASSAIDEVSVGVSTLRRINWQTILSGGSSSRDADSTIESISADTVALSSCLVVDCIGRTLSAFSLDADKSAVADASICIQIQNLVLSALRPAYSVLSVVVVGGNAVGASSFDKVEIFQTNACPAD